MSYRRLGRQKRVYLAIIPKNEQLHKLNLIKALFGIENAKETDLKPTGSQARSLATGSHLGPGSMHLLTNKQPSPIKINSQVEIPPDDPAMSPKGVIKHL